MGLVWRRLAAGVYACKGPYPDPDEFPAMRFFSLCKFWAETDWHDWVRAVWRMLVYISHYGADGLTDTLDWPIDHAIRTFHMLADIIEKENPDT